jgi:hypothetical protein
MRCMGYGDDVIEIAWLHGRAVAWQMPAVWIPVNNNNTLDAYPRLMEVLNMPTIADLWREPEGFAAGFELVEEGLQRLPVLIRATMPADGDASEWE